jgi:hypothetical protein
MTSDSNRIIALTSAFDEPQGRPEVLQGVVANS